MTCIIIQLLIQVVNFNFSQNKVQSMSNTFIKFKRMFDNWSENLECKHLMKTSTYWKLFDIITVNFCWDTFFMTQIQIDFSQHQSWFDFKQYNKLHIPLKHPTSRKSTDSSKRSSINLPHWVPLYQVWENTTLVHSAAVAGSCRLCCQIRLWPQMGLPQCLGGQVGPKFLRTTDLV